MNREIYEVLLETDEETILKELRDKVAKVAGVTLMGNRLTVRWDKKGKLVDVHMIIVSVDDGEDASEPLEE